MAVLDIQVLASAGDAEEQANNFGFSSTAINVTLHDHTDSASRYNGGFRFPGVTIAQAATIDLATWKPYVTGNGFFDNPELNIHTENVDNAVDFVSTADVTDRARSATSVLWSATAIGDGFPATVPEIKSIIQTRVDSAGWVSGNALVILAIPTALTTKQFRVASYDGNTAQGAKLHVEYTVPATTRPNQGSLALLRAGR